MPVYVSPPLYVFVLLLPNLFMDDRFHYAAPCSLFMYDKLVCLLATSQLCSTLQTHLSERLDRS